MKLLRLFTAELSVPPMKLLTMAGLAGLSNALILAIINMASENASKDSISFQYVALFFIVISIYIITQRFIMITSTTEVEEIIHNLLIRSG